MRKLGKELDENQSMIRVRIPAENRVQLFKIRSECHKQGIDFSKWVRSRLFGRAALLPQTVRLPPVALELVRELNQLTYLVNQISPALAPEQSRLLHERISALQLRLASLTHGDRQDSPE